LRRREVWAGFLTAMFPDLDALLSPLSPDFYITQHRGLSHSFVLLPLWAVVLGAVAAFRLPPASPLALREARRRLVLVSGIGVLSHILLDWVTSWGTMFFSPISWKRYTTDWLFIIDLVLSGILVLGIAGARFAAVRRGDGRARLASRAALAAAAAYVGLCAARHARALTIARRTAPPGAVSCAAIPQPLSPDRWLLLADDGKMVKATFVDLAKHGRDTSRMLPPQAIEELSASRSGLFKLARRLSGSYRSPDDAAPRVIPHADGPLASRALADSADGVFGRFARFPAAREERGPDGVTRVILRDVRFGYLSSAIDPFTYVIWYDRAGHLLSAGFPSERWSHRGSAAAAPR
jgi:inner membrane protein